MRLLRPRRTEGSAELLRDVGGVPYEAMELFLDSEGDGMEQLGDELSESVSVTEWRFIRAVELTIGTAGEAVC